MPADTRTSHDECRPGNRSARWSCSEAVRRSGRTARVDSSPEGEALHFPTGPDGAHGVANETDEPVRYLMASTLRSPEVAEYPDLNQITVQARTRSLTGEELWFIHDVEP